MTVNVADVAPARTATAAGVAAIAVFELDSSVTDAPLLGAGALSVTRAVTDAPPTTLARSSANVDNAAAGAAVTVNVAVLPGRAAERRRQRRGGRRRRTLS